MNHHPNLLWSKIFLQLCSAPWILSQRKCIVGFITGVSKVIVMGKKRAQGIQGICQRVIIRKALKQELVKEGSEFLRGVVDSNEAIRIKD